MQALLCCGRIGLNLLGFAAASLFFSAVLAVNFLLVLIVFAFASEAGHKAACVVFCHLFSFRQEEKALSTKAFRSARFNRME